MTRNWHKHAVRLFPAIALAVGALHAGASAAQVGPELLVCLKQSAVRDATALQGLSKQFPGGSLRQVHRSGFADPSLAARLGLDRTYCLRFAPGADVDSLLQVYRAQERFEFVEPNAALRALVPSAVYPNDPYFNWLWGLDNREKFGFGDRWTPKPDADIDASEAWDITSGDSSVVVAILDSGCKTNHPELAGRLWTNPGETAGNGQDDDNNGHTDDVLGWDFYYDDAIPEDSLGHGTGVTGVLAANGNNGVGHTGVDWQCKIMTLKVMGNTDDGTNVVILAEAIRYAADHGAHVMNISLGDNRGNRALEQAINYAYGLGVTIAAAAGNDNARGILYPAAYTNVIAVGSTDPDDRRSDHFGADTATAGSNWGPELDVVAPGNNIYMLSHVDDTFYTGGSGGTSLASPHVAGIAALLLAQDPTRTPDDIRAQIQESADDEVGDPSEDTPGWDEYMGHGRVSAYDALMHGQVRTGVPPRGLKARSATVRRGGRLTLTIVPNAVVELFDPAGRRVARAVAGGDGRVVLSLDGELATGVYGCRVSGEGAAGTGSVLVARGE